MADDDRRAPQFFLPNGTPATPPPPTGARTEAMALAARYHTALIEQATVLRELRANAAELRAAGDAAAARDIEGAVPLLLASRCVWDAEAGGWRIEIPGVGTGLGPRLDIPH